MSAVEDPRQGEDGEQRMASSANEHRVSKTHIIAVLLLELDRLEHVSVLLLHILEVPVLGLDLVGLFGTATKESANAEQTCRVASPLDSSRSGSS